MKTQFIINNTAGGEDCV